MDAKRTGDLQRPASRDYFPPSSSRKRRLIAALNLNPAKRGPAQSRDGNACAATVNNVDRARCLFPLRVILDRSTRSHQPAHVRFTPKRSNLTAMVERRFVPLPEVKCAVGRLINPSSAWPIHVGGRRPFAQLSLRKQDQAHTGLKSRILTEPMEGPHWRTFRHHFNFGSRRRARLRQYTAGFQSFRHASNRRSADWTEFIVDLSPKRVKNLVAPSNIPDIMLKGGRRFFIRIFVYLFTAVRAGIDCKPAHTKPISVFVLPPISPVFA